MWDCQCGLAVSSFGWTLAMLSVQLWLWAFDCSSDKCVSSRIASRFTTCSQMRLFTLMILSVSCVDVSSAKLMVWNEMLYIICESHESSVFHFSGRSLLSCHFGFFLLSVFQLPVCLRDISPWTNAHTLTDAHAQCYSQGWGFFSPGNTHSHSDRVVMKDVPKLGCSAVPEAGVSF